MKKLTAIEIVVIVVAGLVPLLWLKPGFMISAGDNIPLFINPQKTFTNPTAMWSTDYLGYANPTPTYLLYSYLGALLNVLGLNVGAIQILFQVLLYMGAGLSMFYFSRTIYPSHKIAPLFAALFYMFNIFVVQTRFNLGFAWLYTFLPLLLALFVSSVNATYKGEKKSANIRIIGFSFFSVVALSVASINPANVVIFLLAMLIFGIYFLVKHRKQPLPLLLSLGKLSFASVLINLWWLLPMLNTFIFSPTALASSVSVSAWDWTHARGSFLNLFWLNGIWGWLPEYVPYIGWYSGIVVGLAFVPFILAGLALLFKSNRSRFNAYLMGCILVCVFVATGFHYGFTFSGTAWVSNINNFLYQHVPLMSMFREPASKFTLLIIPFLALLIGFATEKIFRLQFSIKPKRLKLAKASLLLFVVASLLATSIPLFNPDYVEVSPNFSSYVNIPKYWFEASNWINSQTGDGRVLLTPLDDFYQMPYSWNISGRLGGYYGTDQLLEQLFEKPIVSTVALNGYVTNANTSVDLAQIRTAVKFNQTSEFKTLLDILGIQYIVQRNDIISNYTEYKTYTTLNSSYTENHPYTTPDCPVNETDSFPRNLKSPAEMKAFFAVQPYLELVQTFGKLDIYQYAEAKPLFYALEPSTLQAADIKIDTKATAQTNWDFSSQAVVDQWTNANRLSNMSNLSKGTQDDFLHVDMQSDNPLWVTIVSPFIEVNNGTKYTITLGNIIVSASNHTQVDFKVAQYSDNYLIVTNSSLQRLTQDSFTLGNLAYNFEPLNSSIKYVRFEFRNYLNGTKDGVSSSSLWLKNITVTGTTSTLKSAGITSVYKDMAANPAVKILNVNNINPEKTVITVNASQPFILVTGQVLDKFWVADVNGHQISPISVYLGLKGFMVEQTGQLTITLKYPPQDWFNYCLAASAITALLLGVALFYVERQSVKVLLSRRQKGSVN